MDSRLKKRKRPSLCPYQKTTNFAAQIIIIVVVVFVVIHLYVNRIKSLLLIYQLLDAVGGA